MTTKISIRTDACCKKVCEDLDEEIKARKSSIGAVKVDRGHHIQDSIDVLGDFRNILEEENICKCVTKKNIQMTDTLPRERSERKRYPIAISAGLTRFSRSGIPILPSPIANGCCIDVCRALNHQIKSIDDTLDTSVMERAVIEMEVLERDAIKKEEMGRHVKKKEDLEKMALRKAEWELSQSHRFSSLAYQSYTLKEYRTYMKKNGICRCEK